MKCPSCFHENPDKVRFCVRCRLSFNRHNLFFSRSREHLYWILRRANAGFCSGVVAWFFIPALSRVISQDSVPLLHFCASGILGGSFLGTVDGMIEESSTKTVRGALLGGLGGGIGGLLFGWLHPMIPPEQLIWGFFMFWSIAGIFIGLVSALWEGSTKKLLIGAFSGLIGGGVGGAWGYTMYGFFSQTFHAERWWSVRLLEGFTGGIIGVTLWFAIGVAERFFIFKRRRVVGQDHKLCDHCQHKNTLNSWYCGSCGHVLQESAPPASLNLSPYTTLERLKEMFRFLSRLAATTGVIAGVVVLVVFAPADPFLAVVALVLVAGFSYSLLILFSSFAESLQIFIKK
jgi:hypothetical protein